MSISHTDAAYLSLAKHYYHHKTTLVYNHNIYERVIKCGCVSHEIFMSMDLIQAMASRQRPHINTDINHPKVNVLTHLL